MVIFHSYVSLQEGNVGKTMSCLPPKNGNAKLKKTSYTFMVIFLADGKHDIVLPTLTISFISTKIYKGSLHGTSQDDTKPPSEFLQFGGAAQRAL